MAELDDRFDQDRGGRSKGDLTLHSIDKAVALLTAEQRSFRDQVREQIGGVKDQVDGLGRRVEDLKANYVTKTEFDGLAKEVKAGDDRFDKYTGRVWNIVQAVLLAVVAAVLGLVFVKTGYPH